MCASNGDLAPLHLSSDGAALDISLDHADATAAEAWICEESLPAGPFSSQKDAVAAIKNYGVSQDFGLCVYLSCRFRASAFFSGYCKDGTTRNPRTPLVLTDRGSKKFGCLYELVIV